MSAIFGDITGAVGFTPLVQLNKLGSEKATILAKLESKSMKPDDKLVRKLEKTLDITLMEETREYSGGTSKSSKGITIGDLIRSQRD